MDLSQGRLRWGILSTARVLRRFVPAVRACPRSLLLAVASRELARAQACAARWDIPRAHASYDDLLKDPEIDAVYLALPNHLHAPWAARCAVAGKHVLCEKPLALSAAEAQDVAAAATRHRVQVVEAFVHLHHPQANALREVLAQGHLGRLTLARACFGFRLNDPGNIRWDPARGGGALWDVGCYPISLLLWLLGGLPVEVFATQDSAKSGVDQAVAGTLAFATPDGRVLAHFDCGFLAPLRETMEIAGERGALIVAAPFRAGIDGTAASYALHLEGAAPQVTALPAVDPFVCEVQALEAAVLDGRPAAVPLAFSRQVAATLEALHQALRARRPVTPDAGSP